MEEVVSYAQNREDLLLYSFFRFMKEPGFYVDVGANDPVEDSVTKFFYDRGWKGINIEPNATLAKRIEKQRPKDTTLAVGVSSKPGSLSFREYTNHGLSTFSDSMKSAYSEHPDKYTKDFTEYKVKVKTLAQIFVENNVKEIQFMKVDVEGYEFEVLQGNDWEKYKPAVICIESNHVNKDWRPILSKAGYTEVFFDGINDYYVSDMHTDLAKNFSYEDVLLLGPHIIDWRTENRQSALQATIEEQNEALAAQGREIDALQANIVALKDRIGMFNSLTYVIRHSMSLTKNKLRRPRT